MEASPAVVLTFMMGVGFSSVFSSPSSKASMQLPKLVDCVFFERTNVTCRWKHEADSKTKNYTLEIWDAAWGKKRPDIIISNCTANITECTMKMEYRTSRHEYCIMVTAHMDGHNISSEPRCRPGREEVKLPSPVLKCIKPVPGSSQCLGLEWVKPEEDEFPLAASDIQSGLLNSQIEFGAKGEHHDKVTNVSVTGFWFKVCGFRPNTSYSIRLRHRFKSEASPWSEWSKPLDGRTGEAAPSAAPVVWRRLRESPHSGLRRVSLLWKPLPPASGRVLFYNVTCQTEKDGVLNNLNGCKHLDATKTSCSVHLPADRCSCSLTASTFGGASPEARLWIPESSKQAPSSVGVSQLSDSSVEVGWTPPVGPSVSGFVVEWFAVGENGSGVVHWEKVGQSSRSLVITEGLTPEVCYAVSVRVLYEEKQIAGENRTQFFYTREGAPSAGPKLTCSSPSDHTVELRWQPLPVHRLCGFLQNYTLYITESGEPWRNLTLDRGSDHYTREKLPPGNYQFSLGANTGGRFGRAGDVCSFSIAAEAPLVEYVLLSVILTSVLLVLMVVLARIKIMNDKLSKAIPDPSNSSVSHWIPKTDLERPKQVALPDKPEVSFPEVLLLGELEASDRDQDQSYRSISSVRTPLQKQPSPLHVDTPESVLLLRNLSEAKTSSIPNLSARPFVLPDILFSHPPKTLPFMPAFGPGSGDWQRSAHSVGDAKQPPGGAESSDLPPADVFCPPLKQHQSLCSLSDLSGTSHSSSSQQAEAKQPVSQSAFNSFPSLQCAFTAPNPFTAALPPFSQSMFVDPSYCPLQCDPYIPSDA
ncbi:interleukin-31 receptor subunit alpha isoform X2 [Salarias fasciatus]|uniref:interleukin-31 receptor subunit alpha isoform X2 n=1 Tax=Salarias fasciatus TaxID=181472 RepID=UPI00117673D5|nr:interleukin-31 receptor subunit alpha-like isoform X2 [Salarias fasciatus]